MIEFSLITATFWIPHTSNKFLMSCVDKEIKACIAPDEIVDDFTLLISEKIGKS